MLRHRKDAAVQKHTDFAAFTEISPDAVIETRRHGYREQFVAIYR